jgi:hypothetical protein
MPTPAKWRGHDRLTVYYPVQDTALDAAYRACDRFRVLAKQQGGPH